MPNVDFIVIGGTGLIGSAVCHYLTGQGASVLALNSQNYTEHIGSKAQTLINCNGNSYRYRANQDPAWDFEASVLTVQRSLFDFEAELYCYISTIDVYQHRADPTRNHEAIPIEPTALDTYGFHKWLAERLVEKFAPRSVILRTGTVIGAQVKKGPLYDLVNHQPLYMSPKSELSLVSTDLIAQTIARIVEQQPTREIINLTGTGPARLSDIHAGSGLPLHLAEGAETVVHQYHINNDKLRAIMPIPTSLEIAHQFLKQKTEVSH